MASSIPDSISSADLEAFAKKAATPVEEAIYDGLTATEVKELAMETLRGMTRKCKDPMVEKCMMLAMANAWFNSRTEMAQAIMPAFADSNKAEAAAEFARFLLMDASKAQVIYTLVHNIEMDNDFILGRDQDSE